MNKIYAKLQNIQKNNKDGVFICGALIDYVANGKKKEISTIYDKHKELWKEKTKNQMY